MSIELTTINKCIALIGKRNSGKSVLLKYLVSNEYNRYSKVFVISPTECVNNFYKSLIPTNCIFNEWSEDWGDKLITDMSKINAGKSENEKKQVLLILDDCVVDTNFLNSPSLKKIFTRGRHCGLGLIFTTQYLYAVPPIVRSNCDYAIVGQMNRQSIQILADEYLSGDLERKDFISLYNRATRDYSFLVINCNSVKSDDPNEIYGILKAPI